MNGCDLMLDVAVAVQDKLLIEAVINEASLQDASIQRLESAVESAISELAREFPTYKKMTGVATNGIIPYPATTRIAFIRSVSQGGKSVAFTYDSLGIHVERDGTYDIVYSPQADGWEAYDDITVNRFVGIDMMVQLAARNYCILCGRLDEADIFDNRYEQYAETLRLKRRAHLPPRAFV